MSRPTRIRRYVSLFGMLALALVVAGCSVQLSARRPPVQAKKSPGVWYERPEGQAVEAASPRAPGVDVVSVDRQLRSYLGQQLVPGSLPPGCPPGWVLLPYSERYRALGCNAFILAGSDNPLDGTVQAEMALDVSEILGLILTHKTETVREAQRLSMEFRNAFRDQCRCESFSPYEYDCQCSGHFIRATSGAAGDDGSLMLFYYTDAVRFNEYGQAGSTWKSYGSRQALPTPEEAPPVISAAPLVPPGTVVPAARRPGSPQSIVPQPGGQDVVIPQGVVPETIVPQPVPPPAVTIY